jgi:hypothetical protein
MNRLEQRYFPDDDELYVLVSGVNEKIAQLEADLAGQVEAKKDLSRIITIRDKEIMELEAERNDYKSRWEQTGCTRHHAMETAIALNQKKDKQLAAVRALPTYLCEFPDIGKMGAAVRKRDLDAALAGGEE